MALVDLFKFQKTEDKTVFSSLHHRVKKYFSDSSERDIVIATCVAGLCARVAYVDLDITKEEIEKLKSILSNWTRLPEKSINSICNMAVEEMNELSGLENHLYSTPLNDVLDKREKIELLVALFALSASDGSVSNMESEEIRLIAKSLCLNDQYFNAARSTVAQKLAALQNNK